LEKRAEDTLNVLLDANCLPESGFFVDAFFKKVDDEPFVKIATFKMNSSLDLTDLIDKHGVGLYHLMATASDELFDIKLNMWDVLAKRTVKFVDKQELTEPTITKSEQTVEIQNAIQATIANDCCMKCVHFEDGECLEGKQPIDTRTKDMPCCLHISLLDIIDIKKNELDVFESREDYKSCYSCVRFDKKAGTCIWRNNLPLTRNEAVKEHKDCHVGKSQALRDFIHEKSNSCHNCKWIDSKDERFCWKDPIRENGATSARQIKFIIRKDTCWEAK
jgi:hypothetical protein